jgi:hypothetical protein
MVGGCTACAVVSAVHQQAEMGEEVDADERLSNVGHYELPREIPA